MPVKGNSRLATSSLPLARFASVRRAFGALFRGRLVASLRAGPIVAYFWPEVDMKKCLIFFWKRISRAGLEFDGKARGLRGSTRTKHLRLKNTFPFPRPHSKRLQNFTFYKTRVGARALSGDNTKLHRVSGVGSFFKGIYRQIGVVNDTPQ